MGTTPDQIRDEIDRTRSELAKDVDQVVDRTSPRRMVSRGAYRIGERARAVRGRVMGSAGPDLSSVPDQAREQVRGNPMAAGLIAFGAGLLVGSLLPTFEGERQGAQRLAAQSDRGAVGAVREAVTESAQRIGQDAKDLARQGAQQVGETASEGARSTGQQAREQAGQVAERSRQGDVGSPRPADS